MARGQADAAVLHLLHAESGRYNDPYVRRLLPGEAVVLVHLWRREVGLVVRAAIRWGCAGSPIWPAGAWRGGRGAADRVCCWSGCWPRPASRQRPRAASRRTLISRWPPRWRRAPPTPGWPCAAVARACDWTSSASRSSRSSWPCARTPSTARPGCSRGCTTRRSPTQVAALGGYDLSETGATKESDMTTRDVGGRGAGGGDASRRRRAARTRARRGQHLATARPAAR